MAYDDRRKFLDLPEENGQLGRIKDRGETDFLIAYGQEMLFVARQCTHLPSPALESVFRTFRPRLKRKENLACRES